MTVQSIDLNADVGEIPSALVDGTERALLRHLSSANIACGGHAGDRASMQLLLTWCREEAIAVGAHPGYPDRDGFGRRPMALSPMVIAQAVSEQVGDLVDLAGRAGVQVRHVKPHGALYHAAAADRDVATAIARGVHAIDPDLILVGQAGSSMLDVWREAGFAAAGEAFADRRYEADGTLRSRQLPGALLTLPEAAAAQALSIARDACVVTADGIRLDIQARTVCIHGDTPGAAAIAVAVRDALITAGLRIESL